jgi:predicted SAM-dependent methyltransferase
MTLNLHLGCGKRYIPGFIHIDLANFPHIGYRCGIDGLTMFEDECIDLIYCCHALQYFDRSEALSALREWRRVLKHGCFLRLAVPDFAALVQLYQRTNELTRVLGPLFGRIEVDAPFGKTVLYHKTTYDYGSLKAVCEEAGFRSIRRYDWRDTIHKDYDDFSQAYFPHLEKEYGLLLSLNIEAAK